MPEDEELERIIRDRLNKDSEKLTRWLKERPRFDEVLLGTVLEAGGGRITIYCDRDLEEYPEVGEKVYQRLSLAERDNRDEEANLCRIQLDDKAPDRCADCGKKTWAGLKRSREQK